MSEEFGNDYITLTDEDGNEIELEHLDTVEHNGQTYMAFNQPDVSLDDSCELIILKVELQDDGEEMLVSLDDEDEEAEMFQIFSERLDDTFFDDGENDEEKEAEKEGY